MLAGGDIEDKKVVKSEILSKEGCGCDDVARSCQRCLPQCRAFLLVDGCSFLLTLRECGAYPAR